MRVWVLGLSDIGRSPRLQNHALSLATQVMIADAKDYSLPGPKFKPIPSHISETLKTSERGHTGCLISVGTLI